MVFAGPGVGLVNPGVSSPGRCWRMPALSPMAVWRHRKYGDVWMMILYRWDKADGDGTSLGFDWAEVGGLPEGSTPVNS